VHRFDFDFSSSWSVPLRLAGVSPRTAWVAVGDGRLAVHFGPWQLRTPLANVLDAQVTGPYSLLTGLGVRISLRDRGVTFSTTTSGGACVTFVEPVPAALPFSALKHPGATLTVTDPTALVEVLQRYRDV
jgi:hypothetical protein